MDRPGGGVNTADQITSHELNLDSVYTHSMREGIALSLAYDQRDVTEEKKVPQKLMTIPSLEFSSRVSVPELHIASHL